MSVNVITFQVKVRVEENKPEFKPIKFSSGVKGYYGKVEATYKQIIRMFHIDARTQEQAIEIARKKYGEPISCQKVDALSQLANIENLKLEQSSVYGKGNPYQNSIAMDEMVWKKRNKRRENFNRDKNTY